jgi:enoyl-CoA hydratase
MPGYGGTQRIARLIGRGLAMHLCLTAEMLDAHDALRVGLVQKVLPLAGLLEEARRIAGLIAAKAPIAIALTKRAIAEGLDVALAEGLAIEALNFGLLVDTADFKEGTSAFLEKRPATFTGT